MGQILLPPRVKLVMGLLCGGSGSMERVLGRLAESFGGIDRRSDCWDFSYTSYYEEELGRPISRMFISFEQLVLPADLARIKCQTNGMEQEFLVHGKRSVNIDPGYVALGKIVVASTKDANYRVYLGEGIYGQSMLYFQKGLYHPWPWTYMDYRDERSIRFFNAVRERLQEQSKEDK